jgi:hypothetical protein
MKTTGVPETLEEYTNAYGSYLGPQLLALVQPKDRQPVSILSTPVQPRTSLQIHHTVSTLSIQFVCNVFSETKKVHLF